MANTAYSVSGVSRQANVDNLLSSYRIEYKNTGRTLYSAFLSDAMKSVLMRSFR